MILAKQALFAAPIEARPVSEPTLTLEGVWKRYGDNSNFSAVADVSLAIHEHSLTALVGPSGSGKTSLISIMGGILRPTEGSVRLCGTEISKLGEHERSKLRLAHIGFVFQGYNLFPTLTARQNIELVLELKGCEGSKRRAEALRLLENLDLSEKADAYPKTLSGGQRQRIAIARALAGDPALLLADEPTAALDTRNGHRVMKLFRDIAHSGKRAVVVVTHDSRLLDYADRIIKIEDGRIVADDGNHRLHSGQSLTRASLMNPTIWAPAKESL